MKIAVASDDGVTIAEHFGRCAGFEIFEVAGNEATIIERRPNTNVHQHGQEDCDQHDHGGAAHSHESFLAALRDCQAVICRGMGRRAVADLAARGIKPIVTVQDITAQQAVELYATGQLIESSDSCCSHRPNNSDCST
jgi:predicted Fe-Mo cluster-binding NifX family protein